MPNDIFGNWQQICNKYFPTTEWKIFDNSANNSSLFRFTFFTDWDKWEIKYSGYKSYGLVRFVYPNGNISIDQKIYLRRQPVIISLPIPSEISTSVNRKMAFCRRFWRQADWIENHPHMDLKWSITIEGLI